MNGYGGGENTCSIQKRNDWRSLSGMNSELCRNQRRKEREHRSRMCVELSDLQRGVGAHLHSQEICGELRQQNTDKEEEEDEEEV